MERQCKQKGERACKPGSVLGRPFISNASRPAPLARNPSARRATVWRSYLRLLQMGFTKPRRCRRAGALLPHRFSFSPVSRMRLAPHVPSRGVFFSVALSVGSPRPAVSWHLALRSPDFPRTRKGHATVWPARLWYCSRKSGAAADSTEGPSALKVFRSARFCCWLSGSPWKEEEK